MKMFIAVGWRDGMKIEARQGIEKFYFGASHIRTDLDPPLRMRLRYNIFKYLPSCVGQACV